MIRVCILLSFLALATAEIACPTGFKLINNNKCLKVFTTHQKHLEAESDCTQYGGTLATIKNAIDNRAIVNMVAGAQASSTWIGMFCFGNDTSTCYHDDGDENSAYTSFQAGYPRVDANFGGCVYMPTKGSLAGQWVTGACEVRAMAYVCEVPTTVADPTCVFNYNGYCYMPSYYCDGCNPYGSFAQAQQICHQNNMELASVHSHQEVNYIKSIYTADENDFIYLGAKIALDGGEFNWLDGTRMDFDYTDPLINSTGHCMQMDTASRRNNGMWSKVDCTSGNHFLCKRKIPDCAHQFNGYCYFPSHELPGVASAQVFNYAQDTCEAIKTELVSIHSLEEQKFVRSLFNNVNTSSIYLGAYYNHKWGYYGWLDQSPWNYDNYASKFPSTECTIMDTTTKNTSGLWYQNNCSDELYFLCKKSTGSTSFAAVNSDVASPGAINPKFRAFFPDASQCNSTFLMAPGIVTSPGYPIKPMATSCYWKIVALGPYRVGVYFTDLSVANQVDVYDEYGNLLGKHSGYLGPFEILAPTNMATITHDGSGDASGGYKGFRVVVMPY